MSRQSNFKPRRQSQGMTPTGDHSGSERHIIYRRLLLKFSASNRRESRLEDVSFLHQHICVVRILYHYIVLKCLICFQMFSWSISRRCLVSPAAISPALTVTLAISELWSSQRQPRSLEMGQAATCERQAAMCAYVTRLFLIARIVGIQSILYIYTYINRMRCKWVLVPV